MCRTFQFLFNKGENASQQTAKVNSVNGPDTVTASNAQFWFCGFRSGNFDVKMQLALEGQLPRRLIK